MTSRVVQVRPADVAVGDKVVHADHDVTVTDVPPGPVWAFGKSHWKYTVDGVWASYWEADGTVPVRQETS